MLLLRVCSLILLVFVSFVLISYLSIRSELRAAKFRSTLQSSTPRPICVILVHVLFAIYIYLRNLVSNTIFISDDRCSCRIKVTQRVSLVKQEVLTLSVHPSSHRFCRWITFAQYLVFCVLLCRYKSLCTFCPFVRLPPWLGWPLWYICVTNDQGYFPLVATTSRSFPHSWLITGFVTRLIWRVPLVEEELETLPEHLSSPPVSSGVTLIRSLVLCVCFVEGCFVLFLLAIVLSVPLRFTDSDYPFYIFILFLN